MNVKWLFCVVIVSLLAKLNAQRECTTPDNIGGVCIPVKNCAFLLDQIRKASEETRKTFAKYICERRNGVPYGCCPGPGEPAPPDVSRHRNVRLVNKDCGEIYIDDRILNGNLTAVFEFPWMALLAYNKRNVFSFECGGSLINNNYVLTAAHCVQTGATKKLAFVRLGEHDVSTDQDCNEDNDCARYEDYKIAETIVHPQFGRSAAGIENDIALIRLEKPATRNEAIKPICLPTDKTVNNPDFRNINLTVTGWGITELQLQSKVLLKAELPYRTTEECSRAYGNTIKIDYKKICVGGVSNVNAGVGDSGGPLQRFQKLNELVVSIQYGIVSFGSNRNLNKPSVYTRVSQYMDWILDNIRP